MARQQLEQLHQAPRHDLVLGRALGHVCPERLELPRELVHAANELRHSLGLVEDCVEQQRTLLLRVHVDRLGRQDGRPAQVHDGQAHRAQVTVYRGVRVRQATRTTERNILYNDVFPLNVHERHVLRLHWLGRRSVVFVT